MGKTILIADDAAVFRQLEQGLLAMNGYRFVHAEDGAQAVKLAVEEVPDLILLDVQMPVLDGVQALQFLKKDERTKDIPVLVVSTIGRQHDGDLLMQGGANAYMTKPLNPRVFVTKVRELLGERV